MKTVLFGLVCFLVLCACAEEESVNLTLDSECGRVVLVDGGRYSRAQKEGFTIKGMERQGDCLFVELESSGCSGDSWSLELIDSGRIAESAPEQRYLTFDFDNEELCDAVLVRTYSFDLRPLQLAGNAVILNVESWQGQIRYDY